MQLGDSQFDAPPGTSERGAEAFARLAGETRGMEVVGPPLAETIV